MESVAFVFFWLGDHAFVVLFACIGLGLWAKPPAKNPRVITPEGERRGSRMLLAVLLFVFGFANLIVSALWVNPLVFAASVRSEGVVLSISDTNTTHNKKRVMESRVLLRRVDGTTTETSFLSTSSNFVPALEVGSTLPRPGVTFSVRYLPNHPDAFLILTDDESAYARELRCEDVGRRAVEARARADFEPQNAAAHAESEKLASEWSACKSAARP